MKNKKNSIKILKITQQILDITIFAGIILIAVMFMWFNVSIIHLSISRHENIYYYFGNRIIFFNIITLGLLTTAILYIIHRKKKKHKNPDLLLEEAIAKIDERGINISSRVFSATYVITLMLLLVTAIVMGLLGYIMVFSILFGIVCVSLIISFIFGIYYNKKM